MSGDFSSTWSRASDRLNNRTLVYMANVVLVNLGTFQEYILDSIRQLAILKYNISVIVSDELAHHFATTPHIRIILTSTLDDCGYDKHSAMDGTFRNGFWRHTSRRLFYVYSYMKLHNVKDCLHIENDIMVYDTIRIPDTTKVWITMDSPSRCIPGIVFIPNHAALDNLINNYDYSKNDMENMGAFYAANKDRVATFPIIKQTAPSIFNMNFSQFNAIFDGAAIGQYLGGVDPRNIAGDTRGFVNETCVVDYSKYTFCWTYNPTTCLYVPHIRIDERWIPIMNLHIHSKRLSAFSGLQPQETKYIQLAPTDVYQALKVLDSTEYITGERIQLLADVYIGKAEDFAYNPRIARMVAANPAKALPLDSIPQPYDNPSVVFCYSHMLRDLQPKFAHFTKPFCLLTHNSDENIDEQYASVITASQLRCWYAQNLALPLQQNIHSLPIGLANSMWPHGDVSTLASVCATLGPKTRDVYFYFSVGTNLTARTACKTELERTGLVFGIQQPYAAYLKELATYKYAICPPGNGYDSHRIWECYYLGVIPIVLKTPFTDRLRSMLPCVVLSSWSAFDRSVLPTLYPDLLRELLANIRYLKLSHYKDAIHGALAAAA